MFLAMMADRHKRRPVAVRLPEDLEQWLRGRADKRNVAFNAMVVEALQAYRESTETPVAPQRPVVGYSKGRQIGRERS